MTESPFRTEHRRQPRAPAHLPPELDILTVLRRVPIFAALGPDELGRVAARVRLLAVARGALVTVESHPVDALYVVARGCFKRFRTSVGGREQILALLTLGDTFGEVSLLDGSEDFASTQAMEPGVVLTVSREHFRLLLTDPANPLAGLCRTLTTRIRELARIIDDLSFCHVAARIAALILEQGHHPDRPHLTQATMAAMTGTTREVVARTVGELQAGGAIDVHHGRIVIRDLPLLLRIAGRQGS